MAERRAGVGRTQPERSAQPDPAEAYPPLTARSVVASVLLGTEPPVMSSRALVRAGEVFGLAEGTVRTALSRMVGAGELRRDVDGRYELIGHLAQRQSRQLAGRRPDLGEWGGLWEMWVVDPVARPATERSELRRAARELRLAELRDGVWLRPDNLDPRRLEGERATLAAQCRRFATHPDDDTALAEQLWDLDGWSNRATELRRQMAPLLVRLHDQDTEALRPGFVVAAAALRHLASDPLLPRELLPRDWAGGRLRGDYETYDTAFAALLRRWLRAD